MLMKALLLALVLTLGSVFPASAQVVTPWTAQDIGAPALAGSSVQTGTAFTVTGSGVDIWGTSDQFQFVSQPLTGDGTITAQVTSLVGTDPWTKAGLMIRQDSTAGSAEVSLFATVGNGLNIEARALPGAASTSTNVPAVVAPVWLRLTRAGSLFTASRSLDGGVTWGTLATETVTMTPGVLVGLAVTAHNPALMATGTFASVTLTQPTGTPPVLTTSTASWTPNAPTDNVVSYLVSYGTASGSYTTQIPVAGGTTASVPVPNLVVGTTYYFVIQAINSTGLASAYSPEVVYTAAPHGTIQLTNVTLTP